MPKIIPTLNEKLRNQEQSDALLKDLFSSTLLQNAEEKQKLIANARSFAETVHQESNLDARTVTGVVPEITAPADGNWLSVTLRIESRYSSYDVIRQIDVESGHADRYPVQFASCIGPRSTMEDEHIAATLRYPNVDDSIGLVGVFDGHGGPFAASFMGAHIVDYLQQEFDANHEAAPVKNDDDLYAGCILALHNAFLKIDEAYSTAIDPRYQFEMQMGDGTTAIAGLIVRGKLIVANLGDSRAILIRKGKPIPMTVDAESDIKRYYDQVTALGGYVLMKRVCGQLATPAAIGDHTIKGSVSLRKCIVNVPEITIYDYQPGDKMVMACDGLWDALSSNKVAETISKRSELVDVPEGISDAVRLTRQALLTPGQYDNVTVAIADLT